jgi:hypothetical protein
MAAKVLILKSGTRDSNPRLRPWQICRQLETKNIRVYVVHSNQWKCWENRTMPFRQILNGVEMEYNALQTGN